MHFKVIFELDGSGVIFNPVEPIHLDGLLAWCLAPRQKGVRKHLQRSDIPDRIRLPLLMSRVNGVEVYHASALFPQGPQGEDLQFWRKRFRQNRIELTKGSPNLTNATYRDWNTPVQLILCRKMVAYASGNKKEVKKILRREVKYLGKKRAHGHGRVVDIALERIEADCSLQKEGVAMRFLPDTEGFRMVRPVPPYWHPHGRVKSCEVGARVTF